MKTKTAAPRARKTSAPQAESSPISFTQRTGDAETPLGNQAAQRRAAPSSSSAPVQRTRWQWNGANWQVWNGDQNYGQGPPARAGNHFGEIVDDGLTGPPTLTLERAEPTGFGYGVTVALNGGDAEIGTGSAQVEVDDGNITNVRILRVDVEEAFRSRGYGLALMQALLQDALAGPGQWNGLGTEVNLVADESETGSPNLRDYYRRMGLAVDPDEVEDPNMYAMKGPLGPVIGNLQVWRAARYPGRPVRFPI